MKEAIKLLADIKTVLMDRLDAKTADGKTLSEALKELETLLNKAK
jgi:hypothetical protein